MRSPTMLIDGERMSAADPGNEIARLRAQLDPTSKEMPAQAQRALEFQIALSAPSPDPANPETTPTPRPTDPDEEEASILKERRLQMFENHRAGRPSKASPPTPSAGSRTSPTRR